LLQKGADVNVPLSDGLTALHYAASLGDAQMAEMLIYAGANPQARTRINDYTPLHLAAESGSGAVVKMLLNAGADVNATTTVSGVTPIHLAASAGNVDAVNALLEKGANPNAREAKWDQTPLIFAAANNQAGGYGGRAGPWRRPEHCLKGREVPPASAAWLLPRRGCSTGSWCSRRGRCGRRTGGNCCKCCRSRRGRA